MATATYEPIATTTLGSTSSNVSFTSISGSYTDLRLVIAVGNSSAGNVVRMRVNSDTGSNYSRTELAGNGSSASSTRASNQTQFNLDGKSNSSTTPTELITVDLLNYSNTTTYKTILNRANNAAYATEAMVQLWRSTSAITQIDIFPNASTFVVGSTFTLYGIKAA
jgi:hypothetical protein